MRLSFLIILSGIFLSVAAKDLVIVSNPPGEKINTGKCVLYSEKNDSIGSVPISDKGILSLPDGGYRYAEIQAEGFAPKLVDISKQLTDTVYVRPNTTLDELVVTPDFMQDLGNRKSYRIPMTDMERYPNFLMALNEIPQLHVLPGGSAYYEGKENIAFLLNGVATTVAELQTISKEDIAKVDVYSDPPARFAARGVSTVVDVRLKSNVTGGNFAVDIEQAFYPLKGNNSAAFYYNYKRSRFSAIYSGSNNHSNKFRQNEKLEYEFDGVKYEKIKKGKNSDSDYDLNNLSLSFQNNKENSYLYNLNVGMAWERDKRDYLQNVFSNSEIYDASNYLNTKYNKYNVSNYFEKQLGGDAQYGTILANVTYQHYDTKYLSAYKEYTDNNDISTVDSHSSYNTKLDGVLGEIQYELPKNPLGYVSLSLWGNYFHSRYIDSRLPFSQKTSAFGVNVTWMNRWRSLSWYVVLGVDANRISTTVLEKPYKNVIPSPTLQLSWSPVKALTITGSYSYSMTTPSIAQLSETDQWLDNKLVYHGNPALKPSKIHDVNLWISLNNPYIVASLSPLYKYSPSMICSQYAATDKYMLETIVNLNSYHEFGSRLSFRIMPLGNNKLMFWNSFIYTHVKGKNEYYSWSGNRFQWMSQLSLNLKKWTVSAFYQFPGRVADGQLIRPRAQAWYVMGMYRPINDMSVGLRLFMPFGKGFRDSEHTVKAAPVYWEKELDDRAGANYVSILFSWNISFGRNKNSARPKFSNGNDDSGILKK